MAYNPEMLEVLMLLLTNLDQFETFPRLSWCLHPLSEYCRHLSQHTKSEEGGREGDFIKYSNISRFSI